MKFDKLPTAEPRPGDSAAMREAIEELERQGVDVRRPLGSPYQLKVAADLSYFPDKGTIYQDGARGAMPERGLRSLIKLLKAEKFGGGSVQLSLEG